MRKLKADNRQAPWEISAFYLIAVLIPTILILWPVIGVIDAIGATLAASERTGIELKTDLVGAVKLASVAADARLGLVYMVLIPATPTIAAILVSIGRARSGALARLVAQFRFWAPDVGFRRGLAIWAGCVATFVLIALSASGIGAGFAAPGTYVSAPHFTLQALLAGLLTAMFLDGGGVGEETGWRGFVLPRLQTLTSPLFASVLLGTLWWAWHLPQKLPFLEGPALVTVISLGLFWLRLILMSIIMTYFYNMVGGSILIAIAMHGLSNDSIGLAGMVDGADLHATVVSEMMLIVPLTVAAIIVSVMSGGSLARRVPQAGERNS